MKKKKSDKKATPASAEANGKKVKKKKKKVAKAKSDSSDEAKVKVKKKPKSKTVKESAKPTKAEKNGAKTKKPVQRDVRRTLKKKQEGEVTVEDCKNRLDDREFLKQWGFSSTMCQKCGVSNSQINGYMMNCSRCKKASYCSVKCFNAHINIHQLYCQTTTIDREPMRRAGVMPKYSREELKEKFGSSELSFSESGRFSEFTMDDSSELPDSSDDDQSIGLPSLPLAKKEKENNSNNKESESDSVSTGSDDDSDLEPLRKKFLEESPQKEYLRGKKLSNTSIGDHPDEDSDQKYLKFTKHELSCSEESDPEQVRLRHAETESKEFGWSKPDWTKRSGSMRNAEVPSLNNANHSISDLDDYEGDKEMSKAQLSYNTSEESIDFGADSTGARKEDSSNQLLYGDHSNGDAGEDKRPRRLSIPKKQLSVSESSEIGDGKLNHACIESKEYEWDKPEWAQEGKVGTTVHDKGDRPDSNSEYISPGKKVQKDLSWSKPDWVETAQDRHPRGVGKLDVPDLQECEDKKEPREIGELHAPDSFQHLSPKHSAKILSAGKDVSCIGSLHDEENEESRSVHRGNGQRKPVQPAPSFSTFEKETAKFATEGKKQYGWEKPSWATGGVKLKKTGKTKIR